MNPPRLDRPIPPWLLLLMALVLWGGEYIRRDLWEPDEARFALVAREAREAGHRFILYRQGEPYTHKPPLFFWLVNSAINLGMPERIASRSPSFLGALMALWAMTRLAARWHGPATSWWVALLMPTSYLFWNKGGFGQIDMLLCGLELMGLYFLFTAPHPCPLPEGEGDQQVPWRHIAAYMCFGLAILAKGPVGLLVPLAVFAAASWAAGERAQLRGWHWLWGPLVSLLFPAAWLAGAWWSGATGEFFNELLFKQNIGRAAGMYDHLQPWYYFLLYFPLDFLPWTALLPVAWRALGRDAHTRRERARLLAWIVAVIVLFSLSRSKRNLYILLAYPAAALLVAASIRAWAAAPTAWLTGTRVALLCFAGVLAAGLLAAPFIPAAHLPLWAACPPAAALIAGAWWVLIGDRHLTARALAGLAIAVFAVFTWIGAWIAPEFNDEKTPVEVVPVAQRILQPGEFIIFYRLQGEIISLHAKRPGRMADNEQELRALIAKQPRHLIVTAASRLADVQAIVGADATVGRFHYGSKQQAWVALEPPAGG